MLQETCLKTFAASYLGLVPYGQALQRQRALALARSRGVIPDTVLLLQHPHVYTIGRFRGAEDLGDLPEGVEAVHTDRGGGITYHGPGQLVGYPIINLRGRGLGVRRYIWNLEEVIIRLLDDFDIKGGRHPAYPGGVWAEGKKLCSVGISVSRGITRHGFALNVATDLSYFEAINPCGISGPVMTAMFKLLGCGISVGDVVEAWLKRFREVFGVVREDLR